MLNKKYKQTLVELEKIENIIDEISVTATDVSLEEYNELSREISSLNPDFYNNRGISYYNIAEYDKAISDFEHAIDIDSDVSYFYGGLAIIYSAKNDKEKFYEYLEKALSKKYPLIEEIEKDEEIKKLYDKYKDEKTFKDLMKKYNIDYPE